MSGILAQLGCCKETQSTPAMSSIAPSAGPPTIFTITFASAHGLLAQDTITISGATPSTYNGTWTIFSVPSSTTATVVTPTLLAANTVVGTYVAGIYGRGGTPDRFYDVVSEGIKGQFGRIESNSLRSNSRVQSSDRFAINKTGANGPLVLEVTAKQFGRILEQLFGAIATTGPTDTAAFTHTATIGPMLGKSLLWQIGRAFTQSQMRQPFTYPGCKVLDWTFDNSNDGVLTLTITVDAMDEQTTVVLAADSYPAAGTNDLLYSTGGLVTVGGGQLDVSQISIKCDMGYAADRRFIRQNTLQREPAESAMRNFTFSLTGEFTDLTNYNRFASATRAGALAALSASWVAPTLIAGATTTFPSLTISAPNARFDGDGPVIAGPSLLPLTLSGRLLKTPGASNDACSAVYVTADSTP